MNKIIFIAVQFLSLSCFAFRTTAVMGSDGWYSGGGIKNYLSKNYSTEIIKLSEAQCKKEYGSKVKAVRNINIQLNADFRILKPNDIEPAPYLEATTYPTVVYTAVVDCEDL